MNDGDHDFTLRDLWVFVRNLTRGSALFRSLHGDEDTEWGITEHLLAVNADALNLLVWLKTADAENGRNQPRPIPRPGVEDDTKSIGDTVMDFDEMYAWLDGDFREA